MIPWLAVGWAVLALFAFGLGGYLTGLRRGRIERGNLRIELKRTAIRLAQLDQQVRDSSQSFDRLKAHDLQSRELKEALDGLLRPMVERERLGFELTRLDGNFSGRTGLSRLLTAIAQRAGFASVLITDNNGLPLAQNDGAPSADMLTASVGLLLGLVERIRSNGAPAPIAVVLRDSDNGVAVHRFFRVDERQYVLTAVASGSFLSPDVLDPTLARIERLMSDRSSG